MSIQCLCPFLFSFFDVEVYEFLCINPLLDTFESILSHSVFCFFVLLIVSFAVQKLFMLI